MKKKNSLNKCSGKLMEGLTTPESLLRNSDFSPKMMKKFYSLIIRQAQWKTTLQKHTNIILKATILEYPHKVSL